MSKLTFSGKDNTKHHPDASAIRFRTIQLGSDRQPDEGLRIGAVRYLPHGVRKVDYSKLNLFDLWLPILAPSRVLLNKFRNTGMSLETFGKRYRNELSKTDARQVIQLVVEMARKMPVSLGCYCVQEARCHRSILGEVIREAAGLKALPRLTEFSIYTILHPKKLESMLQDGAFGVGEEMKSWTSGLELFHQAKSQCKRLPILFGDATDCSKLIYWAQLDDVLINSEKPSTTYRFSRLQKIPGKHSPQELSLLRSGEKIAEGFIKPYALVKTPEYLR